MPRLHSLIAFLLLALPAGAGAQSNIIGIIDFYGLESVDRQQVREALGVAEGDTLPRSWAAAEKRIAELPGVAGATVNAVCCEGGRTLVYIGVREDESRKPLAFRRAPRGKQRLPKDVVEAGAAFETALEAAVRRGVAGEDDSQGHALMEDSAARAIQLRFVNFAARDGKKLRDVLRNSSDAGQRALAAQVLGYSADKNAVVEDLVRAVRDPSPEVRNDAMRALFIIAKYARAHPELKIQVPTDPFIDLLDSPEWTDRNKASMALMALTETRDPALLSRLRERALPPLIDVARWKSAGHGAPGYAILGRIGGLSEDAIREAWQNRNPDAVILAATSKR